MKRILLLLALVMAGCSKPEPELKDRIVVGTPGTAEAGELNCDVQGEIRNPKAETWEAAYDNAANELSFYRAMYDQAARVACRDHPQLQFMAIQRFGKDFSTPVIASCWQINAYHQKEPLVVSQLGRAGWIPEAIITDGVAIPIRDLRIINNQDPDGRPEPQR